MANYGMKNTGGFGSSSGEKTASGHLTMQNFDKPQMELYNQQFANAGPNSFTGKLAAGDEGMFNQLEAPALKQFNQFQGSNASRFSGMGTGGRKNSGFQNSNSAASSDFAEKLQSNRVGLQQQAIRDLMGMSNQLLGQQPYSLVEEEEEEAPWWEKLLGGLAPAAGAGIGGIIGSAVPGVGTWAGAKLGGAAGSAFNSGLRR